eukprot:CAMPEP_0184496324 /NCGR_PEP_ID=MMETSP0113_2-20130426/33656_1 /TAXON_ID=91329 /ORGANISM="Norrisiella sphaerica, Strain BC52" /LENGTH=551 /DNA_ID=CAMNT_0026882897 /DNA_START=145 /DNA_END=1800 /DNA_ORIENTATION=-
MEDEAPLRQERKIEQRSARNKHSKSTDLGDAKPGDDKNDKQSRRDGREKGRVGEVSRDGEQERDRDRKVRESSTKKNERDRGRDRGSRRREKERNSRATKDRDHEQRSEDRRHRDVGRKGRNAERDHEASSKDGGSAERGNGEENANNVRRREETKERDDVRRRGERRNRRRDRSRSRSRDRYERRRRKGRETDRRRRRRRSPSRSETSESDSSSSEEERKKKPRKSNFGPAPGVLPPAISGGVHSSSASLGLAGLGTIGNVGLQVQQTAGAVAAAALLAAQKMQMGAVNPEVTRQARRLYIGNLPVNLGLSDDMLMNFFTATVQQLGIRTRHPIMSVWISQQGTFCFVEFRAVKDANNCMGLLTGLTLGGRVLRIGRPADYKPPPQHLADYIAPLPPAAANPALAGLTASAQPQTSQQVNGTQETAATPVLLLLNMVTAAELIDDDEFNDIRNQVGIECEKFGQVLSVIVPRPNQAVGDDVEDDDDDDDDDEEKGNDSKANGVGRIFIRYASKEEAKSARIKLHGRQFGGNKVEARFYPLDRLESGDFTC